MQAEKREFFESSLWYGPIDRAQEMLAVHPEFAARDIYGAALTGNESALRAFLQDDVTLATTKGGPLDRDPLTYLCFSKFLRLEPGRGEEFLSCARALLEAGASANTGFWGDDGGGRPVWESAIYGAAGVASHAELTSLLIEAGADPNDEETPYHVPESYNLAAMQVLLNSGKCSAQSLTTMLLRKADTHDLEGIRMLRAYGADPLSQTIWGFTALGQSLRRDNSFAHIELMLGELMPGLAEWKLAAQRGRGDALDLFEKRCGEMPLVGIDALLAACASGNSARVNPLREHTAEMLQQGGTWLAQFAGNSNADGVRCLLDLGVPVDAPYYHGDGYFGIAFRSTALHVAAWKGWPRAVETLLERGANPNALDGKGRSPLQLAVKACVDSYWTYRRSPDSVAALLAAGASKTGLQLPCGYKELDRLLG